MKRTKTLLVSSFFASFLSLVIFSCSNNEKTDADTNTTSTVQVDSSVVDTISSNTRTVKKKIAAESYYYKTLVTFEKGKTTFELDDLPDWTNKKVNLVVLYEANAPWAEIFHSGTLEITGNDQMNTLMDSYSLQIIKQFNIDDSNEGIVMEPTLMLANPIETAREVSMVDHVLMVNIKEVPTVKSKVTADAEK